MFRELHEEVGLAPSDVELVGSTEGWLRYRLPDRYIRREQTPLCIGQKQRWFLLHLTADRERVRFDLQRRARVRSLPLGRLLAASERSRLLQTAGLRARATGARAARVSGCGAAAATVVVAATLAARVARRLSAPDEPSRPEPGWPYALAALLACGCAISASSSAATEAGYSMLDHRRERRRRCDSRSAEERATTDELRRQIAIFETSRRDRPRDVLAGRGRTSASCKRKIQAQEEELVFYRGIVSPQDGVAGLRIQSLEVVPADAERHYVLRLRAGAGNRSQSARGGRGKVAARRHADGQHDRRSMLAELVPPRRRAYDMAYEFRYFQGLECELVLPVGIRAANASGRDLAERAARRDASTRASSGPHVAD